MLYLSHISPCRVETAIPRPAPASRQLGQPQPFPPSAALQRPLPALYDEFAIEVACAAESACIFPANVPAARNRSAAELALEATDQLIRQSETLRRTGKFLIYAHDTPEPSFYLTPSLMIKKRLGLKQIQPMAISGCGSVSFACAVEMLACLSAGAKAEEADSIIVACDQPAPPMPRLWHDHYPFGDAAVACACSPVQGSWEITGLQIEEWPYLIKQPYDWSAEEMQVHDRMLIERSCDALERLRRSHSKMFAAVRFAIVQQVSEPFVRAVTRTLADIPVYSRSYAPACNLLSSDCLITLHELEQTDAVPSGQAVLLVMAGPLARVGLMLLRRTC